MFPEIKILFSTFFDICCLRKKPQDVPHSINLLTLCLLSYFILSITLVWLSQKSFELALTATFMEIIVIMIFSQVLLQLKAHALRWTQTVTALFGTAVILSLIALPIYFLMSLGSNDSVDAWKTFGLLLLSFLTCWNIVIMAHILRHALEVTFGLSIFIAIAYLWIILSLTSMILPTEIN